MFTEASQKSSKRFFWIQRVYATDGEALILIEQPQVGFNYEECRRLFLLQSSFVTRNEIGLVLTRSPFLTLFIFPIDTSVQLVTGSFPAFVMTVGG